MAKYISKNVLRKNQVCLTMSQHVLTLKAPTPQNGQTHSQTIRRVLPTNCLSVCNHFVGLVLRGLQEKLGRHNSELYSSSSNKQVQS